ncbi:MAG: hypothetical protein KGL35_24745 [Bradyrhizobium sp.]|nr:hypothetical protein [Bradyrhizobium sp.]
MKLPIGSYSFYSTCINCWHQAFHKYVSKTIPFVKTPEMQWGDDVHKAIENRIRHGSVLPDNMQAAENACAVFHDYGKLLPIRVEHQLAMTRDGAPCDYNDYDRVFFRGKLDYVVMNQERTTGWMVDWKTGNVREDPFELETGAMLLKVNQPSLETIKGEYFWMKTGQNGLRYTLGQHDKTYERILNLRAEAETYLRAGEWPKQKSPLCGWCDVMACEHNTKLKRLAKEGKT